MQKLINARIIAQTLTVGLMLTAMALTSLTPEEKKLEVREVSLPSTLILFVCPPCSDGELSWLTSTSTSFLSLFFFAQPDHTWAHILDASEREEKQKEVARAREKLLHAHELFQSGKESAHKVVA